MVLKQRHNSATGTIISPQASRPSHLSHLSRESSNVSLPYGNALSPTSATCSVSSSVGSSGNVVQRSHSQSSAYGAAARASPSPAAAAHPLSPTFFEQAKAGTPTNKGSNVRRAFWSSNSGGRSPSSPSKGPRRASSSFSFVKNTITTVLFYLTILGCGYFIVAASQKLSAKESRLKQMRNDYHILHHKVRETQNALQMANKVNHDLEDRSKQLEKTKGQLERELEASKKARVADATGVNPTLLSGDAADDLAGLGSDEITNLLMRRQDAMKGRITTLQTKIQEISRREAEER